MLIQRSLTASTDPLPVTDCPGKERLAELTDVEFEPLVPSLKRARPDAEKGAPQSGRRSERPRQKISRSDSRVVTPTLPEEYDDDDGSDDDDDGDKKSAPALTAPTYPKVKVGGEQWC